MDIEHFLNLTTLSLPATRMTSSQIIIQLREEYRRLSIFNTATKQDEYHSDQDIIS